MNTQDKTSAKAAMRGFIDAHFDEQVSVLAKLVQCPSDNPPGDCTPHALLTAELLTEMGFVVERHEVSAALASRHGMKSVTNLIVREHFGEEGGPVVAMNAHGDVVPPGEGWSTSPYSGEIRDGWMYGRGAAVSKSDFTTYAYALRALKHLTDVPLRGSVELHFTYDEETGGMTGPHWILSQQLSRPDYVLSAAFSHHVVSAHNGCLHLEITLRGLSAHAARPDTGVDAIEATLPLLAALYRYRDTLASRPSQTPGISHPTMVVGLIKGGINTNVVPDVVSLRVDRRIVPEEVPEQVEAELREVIAESVRGLPGISVGVTQVLLARPFKPVAGAAALTDLVCREASAVMGKAVTPVGVPLYTDARLYSEAGIPTVMYGAGPATLLEANGHRADERVPLAELKQATQVVANVLLELLTPFAPGSATG